MTADKKKWVVKSWGLPSSGDIATFDKELEELLNQLYMDGYAIYKMNMAQRMLIAVHKDEMRGPNPLLSILKNALGGLPSSGTEAKEGNPHPFMEADKSELTAPLISQLNDIMDIHARGGMHIEDRVASLVSAGLNKATRHDIEMCLSDIQKYRQMHVEHTTRLSGKPCSDECSVSVVLLITEKKLKELVDAKPMQ